MTWKSWRWSSVSKHLPGSPTGVSFTGDAGTYGLTAEERGLLHSTRPIRDPIDVLEAKIRGRGEPVLERTESE